MITYQYNLNDDRQRDIIYTLILNAVDHLLVQNERSYGDECGCMYRGPRGLKCAVGALITDDVYNPNIEMSTADSAMVFNAVLESNPELKTLDQPHQEYLSVALLELQEIHDDFGCDEWPNFTSQLLCKINVNHIPF